MSSAVKHGIISFIFFLFLIHPAPCAAQVTDPKNDGNPFTRLTPSMTFIIVLLVALFLMGFFSIYIRTCSGSNANISIVRLVNGGFRRPLSHDQMSGVDASVMGTFPTMVYSEVKVHRIGKGALECAVCLNEFEDDETLRLIPKCDHVFHPECIDAWLASHTTCPVCRADLASQPSEPLSQPTELDNIASESGLEAQDNTIHDVEAQVAPNVEVINVNQTLNTNPTPGSRSNRTCRLFFSRSHTTGHSLVQPCENTDRFTLRLPVDVRDRLLNGNLNRTTSLVLPRETSSRQRCQTGEYGRSSRGKLLRSLDKLDVWVFSMTPPFISKASSMKSPKVTVNKGQGTSSLPVGQAVDSSRPPI